MVSEGSPNEWSPPVRPGVSGCPVGGAEFQNSLAMELTETTESLTIVTVGRQKLSMA